MDSHYVYVTPHGPLTIGATERGVTQVAFGRRALSGLFAPSQLANRAASQIQEFLAGRRREFDVPLDLAGSEFQRAVWAQVQTIPYGQTRTARQVAAALGRPDSFRSVGAAVRQNPVAPLIPTHRVVLASPTGPRARLFEAFRKVESAHL